MHGKEPPEYISLFLVFIYGNNESGAPFKEITQTVAINANGCLD